jgi:hypothetical protein
MSPRANDILAQVRSFVLIAMVTLLIWLLAEAESLRVEKVRVELSFRAPADSGRYVKADPEFPGVVTVRLEGSTARVDALAAQLRNKPLVLEPGMEGVSVEPGRRLVDLRTALRGMPAVRESGASIADVDPPGVQVSIDNLITRENVKVRVQLPPGALVEGTPEPNPASVRLRYPEAAGRELPEDLAVDAPIDASALTGLPEGRRSTITGIRLELPESLRGIEGARATPGTVAATLTLRSRTSSVTLPSVPVHVRLAPTETGIWDIAMPAESRLLTEVQVTGPSETIELIRSDRLKPIAYIPLSFEELERAAASGQPIEKAPVFSDLPTVLKFEARQKTVRLTVKRREEAPTPGSPPAAPGSR